MSNFYKPRYKAVYKFRSKIWPYKNSKLWRFVDKRGRKRFRKGYWHRRYWALTSKKWRVFRFFLTSRKSHHWYKKRSYVPYRKRRRVKEYTSRFIYKKRLRKFQRSLKFYGKIDFHSFKVLYYKSYAKKRLNRFQYFLSALEQRADVVLYRMRFLPTIFACHNFIRHYGILVNKQKKTYPHIQIKVGDIVTISKEIWHYFYFMFEKKIFGRLHRYSLLIQRRKKMFKKWKNLYLTAYWKRYRKVKRDWDPYNLNWFAHRFTFRNYEKELAWRKSKNILKKNVFKDTYDYPFWYDEYSSDIANKKKLSYKGLPINKKMVSQTLQNKPKFQVWALKMKYNKIRNYFKPKNNNILNNRLKIFLKSKYKTISNQKSNYIRRLKRNMRSKFVISYNSLKKKDLYFKLKKLKLLKHLNKIKKILSLLKKYIYMLKNPYVLWLYSFVWAKYQYIKYHYTYQTKKIQKQNLIFVYSLKKILYSFSKKGLNLNKILCNKKNLKVIIYKLKNFLNKKTKIIDLKKKKTNKTNEMLKPSKFLLKKNSSNLKNLVETFFKYYNFSNILYTLEKTKKIQHSFPNKPFFSNKKKEKFYVNFTSNKKNYWFLKKNIYHLYQLITYLNIALQYKFLFGEFKNLVSLLKNEFFTSKNEFKYLFLNKKNSTSKKLELLHGAVLRAKWSDYFDSLTEEDDKVSEKHSNLENPKNLRDLWDMKNLLNFFEKENFKITSTLNKEILILFLLKYYFSTLKNWKQKKIYNMKTFNKKSNLFYNQFFKYQYYQKFAKPVIPVKLVDQVRKLKIEWAKSDPTITLPKKKKQEKSKISKINSVLSDSFKIVKARKNDKMVFKSKAKKKLSLLNMDLTNYKSSITKKSWKYLIRKLKRTYKTFLNRRLKKRFRIQRRKKKKIQVILNTWNRKKIRTKYNYKKNRHLVYWQIPLFYEFDFKTLRGGLIAKPTMYHLRGFFSSAGNPQFKEMISFLKKLGY